jgi:hypothetical protein
MLRLRCALKNCDPTRWRLLYGSYEAIPASWDGFDIARIIGAVCEGTANLVDREVDSMLEVNECGLRPKAPLDFFSAYDLTGLLDEK